MRIFIKKPDEQQPLCWYQWQAQKVLDLRKLPPDLPAWHKGLETWEPLEEVLSKLPPCHPPSTLANASAWTVFIFVAGLWFYGLYERDRTKYASDWTSTLISSLLECGLGLLFAWLVVSGFRKLFFRNFWRELTWFGESPDVDENPPPLPGTR